MFIRILFITLIVGYIVWLFNNKILNNNITLAKIIAFTLAGVGGVYLLLALLSFWIEG
jgi:hypothetical protein